jgi:hypothetical protein
MSVSDAEAAVSEGGRSEPGSKQSEFETFSEGFVKSAPLLITWAEEKPTEA